MFTGQTLFRHDLRTIRDAGDKARHRAAQDACDRETAMRTQIRKFMQDESAIRHEERRREHLALDLACVQRYNDELVDLRDRCQDIRTSYTRHDPILPHASGVSLALPRTHLPVLPTFISTYITTLEKDAMSNEPFLTDAGVPVPPYPDADALPVAEDSRPPASLSSTPALVTLTSTSAGNPPRPLRVRRARLRNEKGGPPTRPRPLRPGGEPASKTKTDMSLFAGPREGYKAPCASSVSKGDVHQTQPDVEPDHDDWDRREEGEEAATTTEEPSTAVAVGEGAIGEEVPSAPVSDQLWAVPSEDQNSENGVTFVTEQRSVSESS